MYVNILENKSNISLFVLTSTQYPQSEIELFKD